MDKKILYLSKIRAISSFAIIILHTFTMYNIVYKNELSERDFYITQLVPWLMMWAVPCFLMVTGVLLLDKNKQISIKKIFSKYILRMILVLILFTTIFYIIDKLCDQKSFEVNDILVVSKKLLSDESWAHLWYIYLLIGIYLLLPLYKVIADHASKTILIYICIIAFIFLSILPFIESLNDINIGLTVCIASIFPIYLFLGYMIHNDYIKTNVIFGILLVIIGVGFIVYMSIVDFGDNEKYIDSMLGNYSFFPIVILSIGMFILIKGRNRDYDENGFYYNMWIFFDKYSFGVYLTHLIYLRILIKVFKFNPFEFGIWMLPIIAIGVYILSLLTTMLIKFIPGLKKLI